jgi:PPP family 3-phenylpropionic acid transporter
MEDSKMKHIQMKYNLLQIAFWMASCTILGYIAVFLKYKGLSNTEIGIVSGISCLMNMILGPYLSTMCVKSASLSSRKMLTLLFICVGLMFVSITFIPLPKIIIMLVYILVYSLNVSCVPFLSMLCMDLIRTGSYLNFGLSRGLGSVAYASTAMLSGFLIDLFNPVVLSIIYSLSSVVFLVILFTFPTVKDKGVINEKSSIVSIIFKYKLFFFLLLGFTFTFAASTALSTYLIDIVKNLGGNNSFYGIAIFFMAASEMPIMAITPRLMKRFNSVLLIAVAAFFYIVRNYTIALAGNLPILLIGMACQSLSYALTTGVITYYVTYHLEKKDHMMGQTLIAVMTSGLGSMIGNVLGGVISDHYGLSSMLMFARIITLVGAIIIFVAAATKGKALFKKDNHFN